MKLSIFHFVTNCCSLAGAFIKSLSAIIVLIVFTLFSLVLSAQSGHNVAYIGRAATSDSPNKIISTSDNHYIVAGQVNNEAALYKIDCNGQIVDSLLRGLPGGTSVATFTDVLELPGGDFIAIGFVKSQSGSLAAAIRVTSELEEVIQFDTSSIFNRKAGPQSLVRTTDGKIFMAGQIDGFGFDYHDIFCARLNPDNLHIIDSITVFSHPSGVDEMSSISLCANGDILFTGVSTSGNLFNCENLLTNFAYVRRVKQDGSLVWQHVRTSTFENKYGRIGYTSAIFDPNTGNTFAAGIHYTGDDSNPLDIIYTLLSPTGIVLDSLIAGMPGSQYIYQTIRYSDPDTAYISVGDSTAAYRCPPDGVNDAIPLFVRITLAGNQINSVQMTTIPGSPVSLRTIVDVPAIRFCFAGALYRAPGLSNSTDILAAIQKIGVTVQQIGNTMSVASVNPPGAYTYQWYLDGQAIPGATGLSVTITASGVYAVSVTDTNGCAGSDMISGTGTIEIQGFRIYPNPLVDLLTLEGLPNEPLSIELLEVSGRTHRLLESKWVGGSISFNIQDLPAGLFFLKLASANGVQVWKITKA